MNIKMKDIVSNDRPRERLLNYGKENISNEELLSIILKTGTKDYSVKTLSSLILKKYGNISNLRYTSINDICSIKGIGQVKAIELLASIELGKRVYHMNNNTKIKLSNSDKVFEYFKPILCDETQEVFYAVYLDSKTNMISFKMLFKGTVNEASVHPREVFKYAFLDNAVSIIVIHNHPTGDTTPSNIDIELTSHLFETGKIVGIPVVDHLIIGNDSYYSFYKEMNNK